MEHVRSASSIVVYLLPALFPTYHIDISLTNAYENLPDPKSCAGMKQIL